MATDDNTRRLKAIVEGFSIPISAVAAAAGISRAYVSRVLSDTDALTGNDAFWLKIERSLGRLIEARRAQVFQLGAVPVAAMDALRKSS